MSVFYNVLTKFVYEITTFPSSLHPYCFRPSKSSEGTRTITKNHSLDEEFGEDANVSWGASPKEEGDTAVKAGSKIPGGAPILESMLFKDDAAELGVVEVGQVSSLFSFALVYLC